MSSLKSNIRKIIIGESFGNSIKYQKGSTYKLPIGPCILTDFIQNPENSDILDVYLSNQGSKFLWKSLNAKIIIEIEDDSNFE